jgi:hypothetical protein
VLFLYRTLSPTLSFVGSDIKTAALAADRSNSVDEGKPISLSLPPEVSTAGNQSQADDDGDDGEAEDDVPIVKFGSLGGGGSPRRGTPRLNLPSGEDKGADNFNDGDGDGDGGGEDGSSYGPDSGRSDSSAKDKEDAVNEELDMLGKEKDEVASPEMSKTERPRSREKEEEKESPRGKQTLTPLVDPPMVKSSSGALVNVDLGVTKEVEMTDVSGGEEKKGPGGMKSGDDDDKKDEDEEENKDKKINFNRAKNSVGLKNAIQFLDFSRTILVWSMLTIYVGSYFISLYESSIYLGRVPWGESLLSTAFLLTFYVFHTTERITRVNLSTERTSIVYEVGMNARTLYLQSNVPSYNTITFDPIDTTRGK